VAGIDRVDAGRDGHVLVGPRRTPHAALVSSSLRARAGSGGPDLESERLARILRPVVESEMNNDTWSGSTPWRCIPETIICKD